MIGVAYIAPNTHTHLEGYYAVPQMGAVLVPINYRLQPDDFEYIINHCGAKVVCAHPDYFEAVDSIRESLSNVEHFVALEGEAGGSITRLRFATMGRTLSALRSTSETSSPSTTPAEPGASQRRDGHAP